MKLIAGVVISKGSIGEAQGPGRLPGGGDSCSLGWMVIGVSRVMGRSWQRHCRLWGDPPGRQTSSVTPGPLKPSHAADAPACHS